MEKSLWTVCQGGGPAGCHAGVDTAAPAAALRRGRMRDRGTFQKPLCVPLDARRVCGEAGGIVGGAGGRSPGFWGPVREARWQRGLQNQARAGWRR